jgi:hypothetical protein
MFDRVELVESNCTVTPPCHHDPPTTPHQPPSGQLTYATPARLAAAGLPPDPEAALAAAAAAPSPPPPLWAAKDIAEAFWHGSPQVRGDRRPPSARAAPCPP